MRDWIGYAAVSWTECKISDQPGSDTGNSGSRNCVICRNSAVWAEVLQKVRSGFITFSTFALESSSLMKQGKAVAQAVYMALSVGICLAAVMLGQKLIVR